MPTAPLFDAWSDVSTPLIGMVHLQPLPGAPRFQPDAGGVGHVLDRALGDAEVLVGAGVHGLLVENFGDAPYFPGPVPAHVVAHMTAIACALRRTTDLPLGINVLRNDGPGALAVAVAAGAQFIRVNVLCGARVTDQGLIQAGAHDLLRDRARLHAGHIRIFADVDVKHSSPLAPRALEDEVRDTIHRGLADAIIVSGSGTGQAVDVQILKAAKSAAGGTPVFIGSGITAETIRSYRSVANGFIVGTALKRDGNPTNEVSAARVKALLAQL